MKSYLVTVLLLLSLLTSCKALDALEHAGQEPAPTEASAATPDVAPSVQPAPASMSTAQAKRYYEAQLAAQRAQVPAKQKNSNNTTNTYQQKISNVNVGLVALFMVLACGLSFCLGAILAIHKYKPRLA